jgi:hypothetical protein
MVKKRGSRGRKEGDGRGDYLAQEVHIERHHQHLLLARPPPLLQIAADRSILPPAHNNGWRRPAFPINSHIQIV